MKQRSTDEQLFLNRVAAFAVESDNPKLFERATAALAGNEEAIAGCYVYDPIFLGADQRLPVIHKLLVQGHRIEAAWL